MNPFSALQQIMPDLIHELERKVPYAAVFASVGKGSQIRVSTKETTVKPIPALGSACLTLFNGYQFFEWSTTNLDADDFVSWAKDIGERVPSAGAHPRIQIDPGPQLEKTFHTSCEIDPEEVPLRDKIDWCFDRLSSISQMASNIVNADVMYGDHYTDSLFVNRTKVLRQRILRTEAVARPYLTSKGQTVYNYEGQCMAKGFELTREALTKASLLRLVNDTQRFLGAPRIEPGLYDVVFDPDFAGLLAHEAFGHGMETDMFVKNRARAQEYLNKQIASPLVNMFDNPTLPGEAGTFFFDDEGWVAESTQIIENGFLKRGMTDCLSATLLGLKRTANGRRETPMRKAYARMTNTYFAPGNSNPQDLIAGIEKGYYLTYPTNGMEDPKGWGMQLEGLCAEEIIHGKLTGKVFTPVIVTGFVPEVLQSITGIGNDFLVTGTGYCGKGHKEYIKTSTGGPSLRLKARLA